MRSFSSFCVALIAATSVAAQEALRFGTVAINPTSVKPGESFVVTYNSTKARSHPQFVDVYIQGTTGTFVGPLFLLQRSSYGADDNTLIFETALPALDTDVNEGYQNGTNYLIWAYTTFPAPPTNVLEVGGTSTGIQIDLS